MLQGHNYTLGFRTSTDHIWDWARIWPKNFRDLPRAAAAMSLIPADSKISQIETFLHCLITWASIWASSDYMGKLRLYRLSGFATNMPCLTNFTHDPKLT